MITSLFALLAVPLFAATPNSTPIKDVEAVLNDWHDAAAKADSKRYFSHFTKDAIFLGTDPTERWTKDEFIGYAKPDMDNKHEGWTLIPKNRHVSVSPDGRTAWFDEEVDSPKYGQGRGSGVLVKSKGEWKVAQYNYSLPIPNDLFLDVVKMIASPPAKKPENPAPATR